MKSRAAHTLVRLCVVLVEGLTGLQALQLLVELPVLRGAGLALQGEVEQLHLQLRLLGQVGPAIHRGSCTVAVCPTIHRGSCTVVV